MPFLRSKHVQEERAGFRNVPAVTLQSRNDFALPGKPHVAFGYKLFSFGKAPPCAFVVHKPKIRENILSLTRRPSQRGSPS